MHPLHHAQVGDSSSLCTSHPCLFQVESLHLVWFDHQRPGMPQRSISQWCKQLQPQLAPSLTTLILENLRHFEMTSRGSLLVRAYTHCWLRSHSSMQQECLCFQRLAAIDFTCLRLPQLFPQQ